MDRLIAKFSEYGERIALIDNGRGYSFAELAAAIEEYRRLWMEKIRPGDVVAVLSDYSFQAVSAFFALTRLKAVVVPITTKIDSEIAERLEIAGVNWLLRPATDGRFELEARSAAPNEHALLKKILDAGNAGLILFSSGSTGKPKAMVHDLANLASVYLDRRGKDLTFMIFLMFDHIGGLNTLLNGLSMGAKLVFTNSRDPEEVCRLIEEHNVNVLPSSPTFLNLMLMSGAHERHNLRSLKMITYGTEAMPEQLLERIRAAFPRTRLLQTFGTSETGIAQTSSQSSSTTLMKIDDPNTEVKIVDGELWLRSKSQVLGYLNASMESFTEDGWFRTGDLVEETEDGYLRIKGRRKEMINVGGEKVLPIEVETVLLGQDMVMDCMVYGERNAITGQSVAADVVLRDGIEPMEARKLIRTHCLQQLDRYKVPARINFVDKTAYGERFKKMRLSKGGI